MLKPQRGDDERERTEGRDDDAGTISRGRSQFPPPGQDIDQHPHPPAEHHSTNPGRCLGNRNSARDCQRMQPSGSDTDAAIADPPAHRDRPHSLARGNRQLRETGPQCVRREVAIQHVNHQISQHRGGGGSRGQVAIPCRPHQSRESLNVNVSAVGRTPSRSAGAS